MCVCEREREREDCTVFAHESFVLACFLRISKHNVWVSQSASDEDLKSKSAFVRQSRTFNSINALRTSIACTYLN